MCHNWRPPFGSGWGPIWGSFLSKKYVTGLGKMYVTVFDTFGYGFDQKVCYGFWVILGPNLGVFSETL